MKSSMSMNAELFEASATRCGCRTFCSVVGTSASILGPRTCAVPPSAGNHENGSLGKPLRAVRPGGVHRESLTRTTLMVEDVEENAGLMHFGFTTIRRYITRYCNMLCSMRDRTLVPLHDVTREPAHGDTWLKVNTSGHVLSLFACVC